MQSFKEMRTIKIITLYEIGPAAAIGMCCNPVCIFPITLPFQISSVTLVYQSFEILFWFPLLIQVCDLSKKVTGPVHLDSFETAHLQAN